MRASIAYVIGHLAGIAAALPGPDAYPRPWRARRVRARTEHAVALGTRGVALSYAFGSWRGPTRGRLGAGPETG